MKTHAGNHQAGFTLLEFIVALVVAAIMASMVYTYFGNALTQSSVPIFRLQKASNLHQVMENIIADYNRLNAINLRYEWQASTLYGLNSIVTPKEESKKNGRYYRCTVAGTSATAEPTSWPIDGSEVSDGGVTWKDSGERVWQKSHTYIEDEVIVPTYNTGHYYVCTSGGESGATEPKKEVWLPKPIPSPWTITDGAVEWTEAGTILQSDADAVSDDTLYTLLPDEGDTDIRYGTGYTVSEKRFIAFDTDNVETQTFTESNILKVTIKSNDSAETLTAFFTIR